MKHTNSSLSKKRIASRKLLFLSMLLFITPYMSNAQVDTGGNANTSKHDKQVIGYITNWDAWKNTQAGVPSAGALTHLNIDYSKYTILNYSFFGVAKDGSLHSGDFRDKNIYKEGVNQEPKDIFYTDIYSSWDMHILFGEIEPLQHINEAAKERAEKQGFEVALNSTKWKHPTWGLEGSLPLPLHKEDGAPGLIELAHQKGVKVMASIGGWSMCKHFPEMAADPVKRSRFIEDCKKLIAVGFDGIDLDWEYPGPFSGMNFKGSEADFENFSTLVEEIRAAIGSDKLITAAMSADPRKLEGLNWNKLSKSMDYFNMMTYDFNGGWSEKAGHNAPVYPYSGAEVSFFNWQTTLTKLVELGVPKSKICFGAPFYGRGVITEGNADLNVKTVKRTETVQPDGPIQTASDFTNWPKDTYDGTPNYYYIKQKALKANSGWTRKWDDEAKVPYLVKGKYFLSYDDEESIGIKAQFINDNELGGTIIWTVYGDLEIGGSATSFGPKLKRWSNVKSPLVNKINEVFANGNGNNTNNPPSVKINTPKEEAVITAGENISITATASDTDGNITVVSFYEGNNKLGETKTAPYQFTWKNASIGSYQLTAKATDNKGKTTTSKVVKITVKEDSSNIPPAIVITSPEDNDTFTEKEAISIKVNASDEDGTVKKVTFYRGTEELGVDTTAPFQYNWKNTTIGTHAISAKATDDKNAETTSKTVTITVKKETGDTAPKVAITAPNNGDKFTEGTAITVTASASDDDGKITNVSFFIDGNKVGESNTAPYSNQLSELAPGSYKLTAQATDNGGNTSTSKTVSITVTKKDDGGNGNNCTGIQTWSATTTYSQSNTKVQHKGTIYQNKWWTRNQNPSTNSKPHSVWKKIGECSDGDDDTGDDDNQLPTVSLTAPSDAAVFIEGEQLTLKATASDNDGKITLVEFFSNGNKIGERIRKPYSYIYNNLTKGTFVFTAKATDDKGGTSTSKKINITVKKKDTDDGNDTDDCANLTKYTSGNSYGVDEVVRNEAQKFKCNIPGWCSSKAAWAYAPGTGSYWEQAWTKIGDCGSTGNTAPKVNITAPINGSSYEKGNSVTIQVAASDDKKVSKVVFFNGNEKLGEDKSAPFSFIISKTTKDNYSLTAKAFDNDNNETSSTVVNISSNNDPTGGNNKLPGKILVGYWHNFNNGSTTPKISEVSKKWDVICVAFAEPKRGSTSNMTFSPYEIYDGDKQAFINDVASVRKKGQKVLISIGGANAHVELKTETEKQEFINSMTSLIKTYGFDGMDIDLEGSSLSLNSGDTDFKNPKTPKIINLIAATKAIRKNIGANKFILSMAPETAYVQGGYGNYSGIFGAYLPIIHHLRNEMNYIHVQHYNTGSMYGKDGKVYQPATTDFHVAMAEMLITGFPVARTGLKFDGLRADQVAIGLPATRKAAGSGYTSERIVQQALDYLIKGTTYPNRSYTTETTYPSFRGLMTWSINWDLANSSQFSNSHRTYLDNLSSFGKSNDLTTKKMFLNPVQGTTLNIKASLLKNYKTLEIFNYEGRAIGTFKIHKNQAINKFNINNLKPDHLYIYRFSGAHSQLSGKIVRE